MERVRGSELPTITIELRRRSRCGVDRVQMQHSARYNMAIMSLLHVFCTRVFWIEIEGVKAATVEHRAATQPARRPPPGGGRRTRHDNKPAEGRSERRRSSRTSSLRDATIMSSSANKAIVSSDLGGRISYSTLVPSGWLFIGAIDEGTIVLLDGT